MAERYAVATGNWSATGTWDGGASLPTAGDTVHANTYTVTIDQDVTVGSVRTDAGTTAAAGGGFTLADGNTINADVVAGTTTCVTFSAASPATGAINGDITGGASLNADGLAITGTGTVTIVGNCTGGSTTLSIGVDVSAAATVNITGNCAGGSGTASYGARSISAAPTVTITGAVTGGTFNGAYGFSVGGGTFTIVGNITSSSNSAAAGGSTTGTVIHDGELIASSGGIAPLMFNKTAYLIHATNALTHTYRVNDGGSPGVERDLTTGKISKLAGFGGGLVG